MTQETPPPPPPDDPQMPAFFKLPMDVARTIAHYYVNFGFLIGLTGKKVPKELDTALRALARGDSTPALELQNKTSLDPYDVQRGELPEPSIGERVFTRDDALTAWKMHYRQGLGYRDIAKYFTDELGCPVSHATVSNYITEIDEEIEEDKSVRAGRILKTVVVPAVCIVVTFLLTKFVVPLFG